MTRYAAFLLCFALGVIAGERMVPATPVVIEVPAAQAPSEDDGSDEPFPVCKPMNLIEAEFRL